MRLRVRPRKDYPVSSSRPSLFARLTPPVVDALSRSVHATRQEGYGKPVEFLPLEVRFGDSSIIYVSYNGGAPRDEGDDDKILDLPACLIPKGLSENSFVAVETLKSLRDASTVYVDPLTCEDWELLETRAQFLEEGALLQQVTVVYSGQILPLWVGKQDVAWVRVLPENFATDKVSAWPSSDEGQSKECIRLVRDTRVIVRPKPRREGGAVTYPRLRVFPTRQDYSTPSIKLAESLGKKQVSTSPGTVVMNPETRLQIPGIGVDESAAMVVVWNGRTGSSPSDDASNACVLQAVFSNLVPAKFIAIHFLTRSRLKVTALEDEVFVRVLSPIEVIRGSIGQVHPAERQELLLKKVELHESRTVNKWRYPCNTNYECRLKRLLSATESLSQLEIRVLVDEPVQIGSFLLDVDPNGKVLAVYQVSQEEFLNRTAEGKIDTKNAGSTWFVRRQSLPPLGNANPATKPAIIGPSVSYEVRLCPLLLNLLPATSHVPRCMESQHNTTTDAVIYGEVGSGKTHTALVLAAFARFRSNSSTWYLDCKQLKEGRGIRMRDILSEVKRVFDDATATRGGNSFLILDDLDELTPNFEDSNSPEDSSQSQQVNPIAVDQSKLIGDLIRQQLELDSRGKNLTVIITCKDARSLLPCVINARSFARTMASPILTSSERENVLWNMIKLTSIDCDWNLRDSFQNFGIGRKTDGFRPWDLLLLATKVRHTLQGTFGDGAPEQVASCVSKALQAVMPLRQLSVIEGASVDWSQIGGLSSAKEVLTSTILNPAKYRRIYEKTNIRLPRGVLVFGSPGCGKSYLIPALAKKCGFSLVMCRGPELLDRYIGASELKVRELFARAAASSPSILFFDEIDALAPRRGSDRTGVTDRVVNQLLTLLDGVEDSSANGLVYVVAATSRPDIVDPAILRPGRLEKHVYFGPPETEDEHTELLLTIARRYTVDDELRDMISSGGFAREAKIGNEHFHRLTPADLKAAFDNAQLSVIHDLLQEHTTDQKVVIGVNHMTSALRSSRPSLPEKDHNMLMEVYKPFRKKAEAVTGEGEPSSQSTRRGELRTALH